MVNMDKPISVGDLVAIVKPTPCCGDGRSLGEIWTVIPDEHRGAHATCVFCRQIFEHSPATTVFINAGGFIFRNRLKRIPPLADLEGKKDAADKPITLDSEIARLRKMVQA